MRYLISLLLPLVLHAADWYVAVDGTSTSVGTLSAPWDLQTALCGGNPSPRNLCSNPQGTSHVQPGDTVWIRGGTYGTGGGWLVTSIINGTAQSPIKVRPYNYERVIINGGLTNQGSGGGGPKWGTYTWFWGLEVTNTSTYREGDPVNRPAGITLDSHGVGNKAINCIVHDVGHPGIGFWSQSDGGELYGNVLYYNGLKDLVTWPSTPTWRGSAYYAQNLTGIVYARNNITFSNLTTGGKFYSTDINTEGVRISGQISFSAQTEENIFVGTNNEYADDIEITKSYTWQSNVVDSQAQGNGGGFQVGYLSDNGSILVNNNYIVGGGRGGLGALFVRNWTSPTVTNNTIVSPSHLAYALAAPTGPWGTWSGNSYFTVGGAPNGKPFRRDSGTATYYTFNEWKALSGGLDADSSYLESLPTTNVTAVLPNEYEPGVRAHAVIYNWDLSDSVSVDMTNGNLTDGTLYQVRDVQNLFGPPLMTFMYHTGNPSISIPTTHSDSTPISAPVGNLVFTPMHTPKQFLTVLIVSLSAASQFATGTTVYLRNAASPTPKQITNAVDNGNYIRVTAASHGLSVGDKITVQGVRGCWRVNGTRTVAVVVDPNTIDLLARDGATQLDCGGTYVAPSTIGAKQYWLGKLTQYELSPPPVNIDGFDGLTGAYTTSLASRAVVGNPAWNWIKSQADTVVSLYPTYEWNSSYGGYLATTALTWHALGRDSGSSYLTAVKALLAKAHTIYDSPGCDETGDASCGKYIGGDQLSTDLEGVVIAFNIVYDQLSVAERNHVTQVLLNDLGMDNDSQTPCDNAFVMGTGTLTALSGSTTVTVAPASAIAPVQSGALLCWALASNGNLSCDNSKIRVLSKNDVAGTMLLNLPVSSAYAGTAHHWIYVNDPATWDSNRCGYMWFTKHHRFAPSLVPAIVSYKNGPYPPNGADITNDQSNLTWWRLQVMADVGASTCASDERGCMLYELTQANFMERMGFFARNLWSGMSPAGNGYYRGRMEYCASRMAIGFKNQLTPSIDITGGNWLKQSLMFQVYGLLNGSSKYTHTYGEIGTTTSTAYQRQADYNLLGAVGDTQEAAYYRNWAKTDYTGYVTGSAITSAGSLGAANAFMGFDWAASTSNHTTLPTQRLFGYPTDIDQAWNGVSLTPNGFLGMISKTGWGASDTSIFAAPLGVFTDHSYYRHIGHLQIFKGNWLYADTRETKSIATCMDSDGDTCFASDYEGSSSVEVGAPTSSTDTYYSHIITAYANLFDWTAPTNTRAAVRRWAGDVFSGRADSAYTYLSFDDSSLFNTSTTGTPNYQIYHYLHIKGGGRDYLLRYVDTSLATSKRMRTYLHFPNNGQTGEGNTSADVAGIIRTTTNATTSMHTKVLLPSSLSQTDVHALRTSASVLTVNGNASVSYPVRHQSAGVSCAYTASGTVTITPGTTSGNIYLWINTADCILVAGHNSSGVVGSGVTIQGGTTGFPGSGAYPIAVYGTTGSGFNSSAYVKTALPQNSANAARRFVVDLGTASSSEYLTVSELHNNTTDSAAPSTVTDSTNWRTVQIAHASLAAVAAFSKADQCYSSWTSTTTHAGTAQYVIAGLCAGNYDINKGGVTQSTVVISSGDETATFNGTAGVWEITQSTSDPLAITPTTLHDGTLNVYYSTQVPFTGGTAPYTCSRSAGSLPNGVTISTSAPYCNISGTPTQSGTFNFTLQVTDNEAASDTEDMQLVIAGASPLGGTSVTNVQQQGGTIR